MGCGLFYCAEKAPGRGALTFLTNGFVQVIRTTHVRSHVEQVYERDGVESGRKIW